VDERAGTEFYQFLTRWQFEVPIERVWAVITDVARYPEWWPGVKQAVLLAPDRSLRVGQAAEIAVRGSLPYTLRFRSEVVKFSAPQRLLVRATGDLTGEGEWNLTDTDRGTQVTYRWEVRLSKPGFALLSRLPGVRPMFERNHERVMAEGYANLCRLLAGSDRGSS
jgi:uncharacterized protein YndB with AHSA1/START domain